MMNTTHGLSPAGDVPSPRLSSISDLRASAGLFLLRCAAAGPLLYHGSQKLFGWFGGSGLSGFAAYLDGMGVPFPALSSFLAATSELGGGLLLLAGSGALSLAPVVFTMLVAAATSARNGFDVQKGGAEYPLTLALVLVALAMTGPGSIVARRFLGRSR